jgi:hypothetical protein
MVPSAAAPKMIRLLWCPVRPKAARSITSPGYEPAAGS